MQLVRKKSRSVVINIFESLVMELNNPVSKAVSLLRIAAIGNDISGGGK